jgi:hypothetical protein
MVPSVKEVLNIPHIKPATMTWVTKSQFLQVPKYEINFFRRLADCSPTQI